MLIGAVADIHGTVGHHHRFVEADRRGVRSFCLDCINRSYLIVDAATLEYGRIDQP